MRRWKRKRMLREFLERARRVRKRTPIPFYAGA